jgi:hypothetical protein
LEDYEHIGKRKRGDSDEDFVGDYDEEEDEEDDSSEEEFVDGKYRKVKSSRGRRGNKRGKYDVLGGIGDAILSDKDMSRIIECPKDLNKILRNKIFGNEQGIELQGSILLIYKRQSP